jgi:putative ABC transport system ATP-binding protein
MSVLRIQDLRFQWRNSRQTLLDIPSISIEKGEKVFLKGASGSGKTTLLSLIGGISTPGNGSIELLGKNIVALTHSQRDHFRSDHIGFIFQLFNLIPYLSVIENIVLACNFSKSRAKRALKNSPTLEQEAMRLLEHLQLNDPAMIRKPVIELSVGQQQRVATARALIGSPEFIIADEPTSALDSDVRENFLQLLKQECDLCQSTLLFVSHDSSLEQYFDRTLYLHEINRASGSSREPVHA